MKFRNDTKENIKYRIGNYNTGFEWQTVRPGEECNIPMESAKNLPLMKVEDDKQKTVEDKKDANKGLREAKTAKDTEKHKRNFFSKRIVKKTTKV